MINTPKQLKALVRNMSKGDNTKAQIILRKYITERFLERLSISPYRNNMILKGGALIAAVIGLDTTPHITATSVTAEIIRNSHLFLTFYPRKVLYLIVDG